ncbi:MAG: hypothetical protein FJZ47_13310 [Candidatus Tectomicrobia bacterium]|uniref:Uncharacterized protein n=1 Tax=Tectimicrobiota bacterium TaxID=2528274 RepID=A0A937W3X7_UNCTE|nr:hypothetical protein [Candidatus Tectomicrobia bacterium]
MFQKGTNRFPAFWVLLPAHIYLVLVGGVSQFTLGMCYWIFPRLGGGTSRGNTRLAWGSYVLLNAALGLVILHPLIEILWGDLAASVAFAGAGVFQSLAALAFVRHIWPRIRPSTLQPRVTH